MPQEFQVLRCFNCEKFQVHHIKKAKKWICKVCGEKQSYIRIYFTGSAKQCRSIVQENNLKAGEERTAKLLAESPNYFTQNNHNEDDIDDGEISDNPAAKKLRSEIDRADATEDFPTDLSSFSWEDNSFFDESCATDESYSQENAIEELPNLDLMLKQPLTPVRSSSNELLSKTLSITCDKTEKHLKIEVPKVKPHLVKNIGFQKIMKAAQKLS